MHKQIFSDDKGFLITYEQARKRYNLGRGTVMRLARESGALVKVGKAARIKVNTMDAYLNTFSVL